MEILARWLSRYAGWILAVVGSSARALWALLGKSE